jgi:phenol 2-monooxygenase
LNPKYDNTETSSLSSVKQKVAETLHKDDYILLAGDAAHTHSSGFAQGMNTGVHDATNLSWKLAGTLKGWYKPDVLATYATERHAAAQKLISIDRLVAAAISGEISAEQKGLGLSAEDALHSILQTNMSFTIGLGISYEASVIGKEPNATTLLPGTRSPDALLYVPGPSVPIRLHSITHQESKGRWSLLVFAGNHHMTRPGIIALRDTMNREGSSLESWNHIYRMSTIVTGVVGSAWDAFDGPALGNLYFDLESIAHSRFGVYPDHGALVVIRPDGVFAFATGLDKPDQIEEFFKAICR